MNEEKERILPSEEEREEKSKYAHLVTRAYDLGYRQVVYPSAAGYMKNKIIFNLSGVWEIYRTKSGWDFKHILDTRDIDKIAEYIEGFEKTEC